jgi:hypothetical protein
MTKGYRVHLGLKKHKASVTHTMSDSQPTPRRRTTQADIGKAVTQRVVQLVLDSIDEEQVITLVHRKLIHPMVSSVLSQLYPYLLFLTGTVVIILMVNFVCCVCFLLNRFMTVRHRA